MAITNIISAIGNNSTIYPLLVRDCFIEAPSKILIARKENMKESREIANDATRERFIDEYVTSAIWLGGIPATEAIMDKFITKKGYNPNVNLNLFKADNARSKKFQGIEYNIKKFGSMTQKDVQEAVADLLKVKNNKPIFEKLLTKKFAAATIIPTVIMGFILPPLNFALTRKLRERKAQNISQPALQNQRPTMKEFTGNKPSFTGNLTSTIANLRTVDKMAISDGGLTVGRVSTSRNKEEAYMNAFRMTGSIILNFVTPAYIAKGLDKLAKNLFKVNVDLDPLILDNKELTEAIKNGTVEIPKSGNAKVLFDFIDSNPNSFFSQSAQKMGKITYLKSGIRDPRKFVDLKDLRKFRNEFATFINQAANSGNIERFANKAKGVKCFNILANIGISSFLLAVALPKAQYLFNKAVTGSYLDPGLAKKS
ncbi:MAG: hypothetical protein K2F57_07265 [Candidatus Gastranaerophilales bacterium]|nr:hypothetical protein [Candidatus Gastranaerophilales bacterium]